MNRRIGNRFTVESAIPDGLVRMDCTPPGLDEYDTTPVFAGGPGDAARTHVGAMTANAMERDRKPSRVLSRWVPAAGGG